MGSATDEPRIRQLDGENSQAVDPFPLVVSPLERYLIVDDAPRQPMSFFVEIRFATPLNCRARSEALSIALARNPLLSSRVVCEGNQWTWHKVETIEPRWLKTADYPLLENGFPRPIDLKNETGARFWYEEHKNGSSIWIQVHHACADGIGMRRFVLDLNSAYVNSLAMHSDISISKVSLDRLDANRLNERFAAPQKIRQSDLRWNQRLKNLFYFIWSTPTPLVGSRPSRSISSSLSPVEVEPDQRPFMLEQIPRDLSALALERSVQSGASINDVGLALLFHVCRSWNDARGRAGNHRRIRLLMPIDLRNKNTLRMPAANMMSFAFLGRTHGQCTEWDRLLASVQTETQWIKDRAVYADFLNGLDALSKQPRAMRWVLNQNRNLASAVLTYSGDIYRGLRRYFPDDQGDKRVGDTRMTSVAAAPPVRTNTNVALGLFFCRDQMFITANWNRDVFTSSDCQSFLESYSRAWREWIEFGRPQTKAPN